MLTYNAMVFNFFIKYYGDCARTQSSGGAVDCRQENYFPEAEYIWPEYLLPIILAHLPNENQYRLMVFITAIA